MSWYQALVQLNGKKKGREKKTNSSTQKWFDSGDCDDDDALFILLCRQTALALHHAWARTTVFFDWIYLIICMCPERYTAHISIFVSWCVRRRIVYLSATNLVHKQWMIGAFGAHYFFTHFSNYTAQWLREALSVMIARAQWQRLNSILGIESKCKWNQEKRFSDMSQPMPGNGMYVQYIALFLFSQQLHTHTHIPKYIWLEYYLFMLCTQNAVRSNIVWKHIADTNRP